MIFLTISVSLIFSAANILEISFVSMMGNMVMSKKDTILATATELFNKCCYNCIGIDKIIAESNVAKMTFYKHFPSKENLIEACLHKRNIDIQNSILEKINHIDSPIEKLKGIFNWFIDWINSNNFNGCLFKKASLELKQTYPSIHAPINAYQVWLDNIVKNLFIEQKVEGPEILASLFIIIIDGIIVDATIDKNRIYPVQTWSYIEKLIKS